MFDFQHEEKKEEYSNFTTRTRLFHNLPTFRQGQKIWALRVGEKSVESDHLKTIIMCISAV